MVAPAKPATRPKCRTCRGYGTADGKPAPKSTAAALLVESSCAACGGSGDAREPLTNPEPQ